MLVFPVKITPGDGMNRKMREFTTKTEIPGMPGTIPSVIHTQCLKGETLVAQSEEASEECQVTDRKESGDTVTW